MKTVFSCLLLVIWAIGYVPAQELAQAGGGFFPSGPTTKPNYQRYKEPEKFSAKRAQADKSAEDKEMVILAAKSTFDRKSNQMTFQGNVIITVKGMVLNCDHLLIELGEDQKMDRVTATGDMVQIKRNVVGDDGKDKLQVAKARKAVYLASSQIATLTGGPPFLQNGSQYVNTSSENSEIIINQKTGQFHIKSPPVGEKSIIVIPVESGKFDFEKDLQQQ